MMNNMDYRVYTGIVHSRILYYRCKYTVYKHAILNTEINALMNFLSVDQCLDSANVKLSCMPYSFCTHTLTAYDENHFSCFG